MNATKLSTPFLLAAALLFTSACDTEDAAPGEERAAELDAEFAPETKGDKHHRAGRMNPAAHLCEEIACSDEQRGQIEALMRSQHEARRAAHGDKDKDTRRAEHAEVNAKLAAAFRAEEFDASVLAELHKQRDPSEHIEAMASFVVELHGLLSPEQRGQLAKLIGERGPMFMHGKPGHHQGKSKHHGERKHHGEHAQGECDHGEQAGECDHGEGAQGKRHHGPKDPEARLARHVERVCEPLACSEEQQTQLAAALAGAHEARGDRAKPDFAPLAAAFAADELEVESLTTLMREQMQDGKARHGAGATDIISEIHAILSPEQRAIFADEIEAKGMHGALGKGHGKRGKGRRHGGPPAR